MNMPPIQAAIFDMGKVLVSFSHEKMCEQVAVLCQCTAQEIRSFVVDSPRLEAFETGKMSEEELYQQLEAEYQVTLNRSEIEQAGADIFDACPEMYEMLPKLKAKVERMVLLSNTSPNHVRFLEERFDFFQYFDELVFSYDVGCMKPDPRIYEATVAAAGVPKENCLFVDDMPANIEGARQFGLQAEVFTNLENYLQTLQKYGITLDA